MIDALAKRLWMGWVGVAAMWLVGGAMNASRGNAWLALLDGLIVGVTLLTAYRTWEYQRPGPTLEVGHNTWIWDGRKWTHYVNGVRQ